MLSQSGHVYRNYSNTNINPREWVSTAVSTGPNGRWNSKSIIVLLRSCKRSSRGLSQPWRFFVHAKDHHEVWVNPGDFCERDLNEHSSRFCQCGMQFLREFPFPFLVTWFSCCPLFEKEVALAYACCNVNTGRLGASSRVIRIIAQVYLGQLFA